VTGLRLIERGLAHIDLDGVEAGLGCGEGDAGTHGSGADDGDGLDGGHGAGNVAPRREAPGNALSAERNGLTARNRTQTGDIRALLARFGADAIAQFAEFGMYLLNATKTSIVLNQRLGAVSSVRTKDESRMLPDCRHSTTAGSHTERLRSPWRPPSHQSHPSNARPAGIPAAIFVRITDAAGRGGT